MHQFVCQVYLFNVRLVLQSSIILTHNYKVIKLFIPIVLNFGHLNRFLSFMCLVHFKPFFSHFYVVSDYIRFSYLFYHLIQLILVTFNT